ncbi:MAG: hypothetical protein DI538_23060 [Azospira oryzae]|nr:MAG: hypothetical protein DI538_23060 [Azospira oryzae]
MKIAFCISSDTRSGIEFVMKSLNERHWEVTVFLNKESVLINDFLQDGYRIVTVDNSDFTTESLLKLYHLLEEFGCVLYDHHSIVRNFADRLKRRMEFNISPRFHPTFDYPNPNFNDAYIPAGFNKVSYSLIKLIEDLKKQELNQFRKELPINDQSSPIPSIYGISATLLNKPKDYPLNSYFTGVWINTERTSCPDALNPYFGEKKLLIILNTPSIKTVVPFLRWCSEICNELHVQPIVINKSKEADSTQYLIDGRLAFIKNAPEDAIPFVDAVIHAEDYHVSMNCLYHGKPALAYTTKGNLNLDDRFWRDQAFMSGCALKPIHLTSVTRKDLKNNIEVLIGEHLPVHHRCAEMAHKLKTEDGVKKATDLIELYFSMSFHLTQHAVS